MTGPNCTPAGVRTKYRRQSSHCSDCNGGTLQMCSVYPDEGTDTVDTSGVPRKFVRGGGVQQIQLRTEYRENGVLGAVAP